MPLELFFGEGALQFGELVLDFAVTRFEVQFLGALKENFVVDKLLDDVQLQRQRFFLRRFLGFRIDLRLVVFLDLIALDLGAIHDRPNVRGVVFRGVATGEDTEKHARQGQQRTSAAASTGSWFADWVSRRKAQDISSGCFFHTAQTDAAGAHAHLLANSVHHRAYPLQIWVPAATPCVIGVANHVSKVRRLAADCALQCHDFTLPALQGIENTTVNDSR